MSITRERKQEIMSEHQRSNDDTGSPEVQIAVLTHRIQNLTEHLQTHRKDFASRRGLLMLVSRRRSLLDYLHRIDPERYKDVLTKHSLRK